MKSRNGCPQICYSFSQDCFGYSGLLWSHIDARMVSFLLWGKSAIGILIGIGLNLIRVFGLWIVLTIIVFIIHEHIGYLSIHLCLESSVSFINVLRFSVQRTYTSSVKFITKYCIIFDAIVNEIIFFISYSDKLLVVYRTIADFYMLILNLATCLNSLVSSNSFLVVFTTFYTLQIETILPLPSQCWCLLSFSCLIVLRVHAVWNRIGESGHTVLFPILGGKVFSLSPMSMILARYTYKLLEYHEVYSLRI